MSVQALLNQPTNSLSTCGNIGLPTPPCVNASNFRRRHHNRDALIFSRVHEPGLTQQAQIAQQALTISATCAISTSVENGEEWRPIPGWESSYEASSHGRIRAIRTGNVLTQSERDGYLHVTFDSRTAKKRPGVHRLVCLAFHGPPPDGYVAAHGDGVKKNNVPSNLRWATHKENAADAKLHAVRRRVAPWPHFKLSAQAVEEIRAARLSRKDGVTLVALAKQYGVCMNYIWLIRAGYSRKLG